MKIKSEDIIIGDNFSANLDDDTLIIKFTRFLIKVMLSLMEG